MIEYQCRLPQPRATPSRTPCLASPGPPTLLHPPSSWVPLARASNAVASRITSRKGKNPDCRGPRLSRQRRGTERNEAHFDRHRAWFFQCSIVGSGSAIFSHRPAHCTPAPVWKIPCTVSSVSSRRQLHPCCQLMMTQCKRGVGFYVAVRGRVYPLRPFGKRSVREVHPGW